MPWWLTYLNICRGSRLRSAKYQSDINKRIQKLRLILRECHTCVQTNDFKKRIKRIGNIQPAILEMIYQELVLDSLTSGHPNPFQRISRIFIEVEGLETDLQILNTRRPGNNYGIFFTHIEALIEESLVTADDRRHGTSHMSQQMSIKDLIKRTYARYPENTSIPSKDLVTFQFIPQNPLYTKCLKCSFLSSGATQNKNYNTITCSTS